MKEIIVGMLALLLSPVILAILFLITPFAMAYALGDEILSGNPLSPR